MSKHKSSKHDKPRVESYFFPDTNNFQIFCKTLEKCKESIDVCVYQLTHDQIIEILIDLANKGKSVRILMDPKCDENEERKKIVVTKLLVMSGFKIQVSLWEGKGLMHCKFCLIDLRKVIIGSANWTYKAFSNNVEDILIMKDETIAKQLKVFFHNLWNQARSAKLVESKIIYINNSDGRSQNRRKVIRKSFRQRKREKQRMKQIENHIQQEKQDQDIIKQLNLFQEMPSIEIAITDQEQKFTQHEEKESEPKSPRLIQSQDQNQAIPCKQNNPSTSQWNNKPEMYQPFFVKNKRRDKKNKANLKKKESLIIIDDEIEVALDDCEIISHPQKISKL